MVLPSQHCGGRGRPVSVTTRSAWSTWWVPGQPGQHWNTLTKSKHREKPGMVATLFVFNHIQCVTPHLQGLLFHLEILSFRLKSFTQHPHSTNLLAIISQFVYYLGRKECLPPFWRTFSVEHRALLLPFAFCLLQMSSLPSSRPQSWPQDSFTLFIMCGRGRDGNRNRHYSEVTLHFSCL